jgi:hypothetical protein
MQTQFRSLVPGLLLAFGAMAVRADPKAAPATVPVAPAATAQSTPLNTTLPPAPLNTTLPTDPLNINLRPDPLNTKLQPAPLGTTLQPAPVKTALPPATLNSSLQPAALDAALQSASEEVKRVARWVHDSGDNTALPFLLVDKVNAQVFAFSPTGQLQGSAPVLLGMARGDRLLASNSATMESMSPQVRITPAGRFVSRLAIDSHGKELLVLDYDASISLHPVVKGTPKERRAERLSSPTSQDNRISFGCINVPAAFYSTKVSPAFTNTKGIVYVLPETRPAGELFGFGTDAPGAPTSSTALTGLAAPPSSTTLGAPPAKSVPAPDVR